MKYKTFKEPKPKRCSCGAVFIPYKMAKRCNKCEAKVRTGKSIGVEEDDLIKLPLPELHQMAKGVVHAHIRKRDKNKPCISCNGDCGPIQCGHLFKAELFSGVEFDEPNLNGQGLGCNYTPDGNFEGYKAGFLSRFGSPAFEALEEKARTLRTYKYGKHELIEIIKKYSKEVGSFSLPS